MVLEAIEGFTTVGYGDVSDQLVSVFTLLPIEDVEGAVRAKGNTFSTFSALGPESSILGDMEF